MSTDDREVSKGIVVNPGRMSGTPCIAGTRVAASTVANFFEAEYRHPVRNWPTREQWVADEYGLTLADVVNAKAWDRRGRPTDPVPLPVEQEGEESGK